MNKSLKKNINHFFGVNSILRLNPIYRDAYSKYKENMLYSNNIYIKN